jgi:hypothetical protein
MEVSVDNSMSLAFDALLPITEPDRPSDLIRLPRRRPQRISNALFDGTAVENTIAPIGGLPPVDSSLLARFARSPIFLPVVRRTARCAPSRSRARPPP